MMPAAGGWRRVPLGLCTLLCLASGAGARSLYVIRDLNYPAQGPVRAYAIASEPEFLRFQAESAPAGYGAVGIALHEPSGTLFVTIEYTGLVCILDARTLEVLGRVATPGAGNLAGIAVDAAAERVYAVERNSDRLFSYHWDAAARVLSLDRSVALPGVWRAMGIALDADRGHLYVADAQTFTVRYFNTADWTQAGSITLTTDQRPFGIALDPANRVLYTGNAAVSPGGPARLCKYDLKTGAQAAINLRALTADPYDCVVGIAADPHTGLVYVTTGNQVWGGTSRLMVFSPSLDLLHTGPQLGNPTGLCIADNLTYGANRPPVAVAGPPQTVEQTSLDGAAVALDGSASHDPDGDPLTYRWTWPGGAAEGIRPVVVLPLGTTEVTLVVNDGEADSQPETTAITVRDTTPPALVAPADITVEQASLAGSPVDIPPALAADACDASPIVTHDAPALFPLGTTLVTWTAIDQAGNTATATQRVTVVDTTPPAITSLAATPATLWPPSGQMVSVSIEAVAEDTCDAAPACRIVAIASSEPVSGPGAGNLKPDWEITGDLTANLRAERLGQNKGRVYTITVAATDASGNASQAELTVTVPHNQGNAGGKK